MTNEEKIKQILIENSALNFSDIFNWHFHSYFVARYCPEFIDENEFNWIDNSTHILKYCPDKLNIKKASLQNILTHSSIKEIEEILLIMKNKALINNI